jgi:hypothetical protein
MGASQSITQTEHTKRHFTPLFTSPFVLYFQSSPVTFETLATSITYEFDAVLGFGITSASPLQIL